MGFASGLPCVPDMLKNRSRTKGERTQDMIRIIGRGAPHGKGGTSLPTSAAVGRVIGENGKKLAFLLVLL